MRAYVRITLYGELAQRLRDHVSREWSSSRGAQSLVMKRALKEYLDKEEAHVSNVVKEESLKS